MFLNEIIEAEKLRREPFTASIAASRLQKASLVSQVHDAFSQEIEGVAKLVVRDESDTLVTLADLQAGGMKSCMTASGLRVSIGPAYSPVVLALKVQTTNWALNCSGMYSIEYENTTAQAAYVGKFGLHKRPEEMVRLFLAQLIKHTEIA